MKNKEVKLVAADIDRTLEVTFEPIPEINKRAIEALHERGILFAPASGRSVKQLKDKVKEWNLSFEPELLIGTNGSAIYDGIEKKEDKLLLFEKDWINEIMDFMEENNYVYHVYIDDYTIFNSASPHYHELARKIDRDVRISTDRNDYLHGNFFKFLLTMDKPIMEELLVKIQPLLDRHKEDFKILRTTPRSYEIVHAKTSKAYGLKLFCERHGIDLGDVVSFGDAQNDNEMLQASGMGVCLKNGEEGTKKVADAVTDLDCGEGGFGDFVFKHILNEE